jgi:hypothetical protein
MIRMQRGIKGMKYYCNVPKETSPTLNIISLTKFGLDLMKYG